MSETIITNRFEIVLGGWLGKRFESGNALFCGCTIVLVRILFHGP